MGIFGTSSPFDEDVEKVTSENNTSEDWAGILEICDRAGAGAGAARECLRAVLRRLAHHDPHVALQAATLLDACVSNAGRTFHLEVASRDFEAEWRRVVSRAQPAVAQRLRALLNKWAENEFRGDPQLDLIVALNAKMRQELGEPDAGKRGLHPPAAASASASSAAAAAAAAQREQEELARAIALSLRESGGAAPAPPAAPPAAALYPSVEAAATPAPARKVRALYDFEAAEDNELTFLAGEIVHVTDWSDPNWWKGYNKRGEGLFPANFVTADLSEPAPQAQQTQQTGRVGGGKSVQFAAEAADGAVVAAEEEEAAGIEESALDAALAALAEASPEEGGGAAEEARLAALERRVHGMQPLIDAALERADRKHATLTQLSADLVAALNLYHHLMRDPHPAHPAHPATHAALYYPPAAAAGQPQGMPPAMLPGMPPTMPSNMHTNITGI